MVCTLWCVGAVCVFVTYVLCDVNRLQIGDSQLCARLCFGYLGSGLHHRPLLRRRKSQHRKVWRAKAKQVRAVSVWVYTVCVCFTCWAVCTCWTTCVGTPVCTTGGGGLESDMLSLEWREPSVNEGGVSTFQANNFIESFGVFLFKFCYSN